MNQTASDGSDHTWKFFRAGGFDQVQLDSAAALLHLPQLDQKLWVALACPISGLEFDPKTLELIDTDKDGRIRAPEIIAAVEWTVNLLKRPEDLSNASSSLPLDAINDATAEGKQLRASARQILINLGKQEGTTITVEEAADTVRIFAQTRFNGDGIVTAEGAEDAAVKAVIIEIISCLGADTDRSGKPGVSESRVDQFFSDLQAHSDWWKKAEGDAVILPLGESTAAAAAALNVVRTKVDDYFTRCQLASFDARAITALNREEKEYLALAAKDLKITAEEIASFPLARVTPSVELPLDKGVNPAWASALSRFQTDVVKPLLGDKQVLTEADWSGIQAKLAPFESWSVLKAGASVEKLGLQRVRELLAGPTKEALAALIAEDKRLEPEANAIAAVERLVRYHRDLYRLLLNFVSFRDFYSREKMAVFQAGRLYLDTRRCDLCLRVADMTRHGTMAPLSRVYLAYCDCVRKSTGEKMTIAAAFMDGDYDDLMVGRNGVFYDRHGRDWDATIVKIIENPISIRQAFWSPYKKLLRFIEEQVTKRATAAETAATGKLTGAAAAAGKAAETGKPPEVRPKIEIGVVAAIGVAVGGITAALGMLLQAFFGLGIWMPLGFLALILIISGPSMLIAWLKLRQRNLGPLLDANGWAVNAKAKINTAFGRSLTSLAKLPPGSERDLADPYPEERKPWGVWITLAVVLILAFCWWQGKLDRYLWKSATSVVVLGTNAPAYKPPPRLVPVVPVVTNLPAPPTQ